MSFTVRFPRLPSFRSKPPADPHGRPVLYLCRISALVGRHPEVVQLPSLSRLCLVYSCSADIDLVRFDAANHCGAANFPSERAVCSASGPHLLARRGRALTETPKTKSTCYPLHTVEPGQSPSLSSARIHGWSLGTRHRSRKACPGTYMQSGRRPGTT